MDKLVAPIPILFEDMNFSLVKGGGPAGMGRRRDLFELGVRTGDTILPGISGHKYYSCRKLETVDAAKDLQGLWLRAEILE